MVKKDTINTKHCTFKKRKILETEIRTMKCTGGAKLIPLTRGKVAIVDASDFDWLNQWKWHTVKTGKHRSDRFYYYAARFSGKKEVRMHHQILNAKAGQEVDHRDGNGLDNRRRNI